MRGLTFGPMSGSVGMYVNEKRWQHAPHWGGATVPAKQAWKDVQWTRLVSLVLPHKRVRGHRSEVRRDDLVEGVSLRHDTPSLESWRGLMPTSS